MSRSQVVESILREKIGDDELMLRFMGNPTIAGAFVRAMGTREVLESMGRVVADELRPEDAGLFEEALKAAGKTFQELHQENAKKSKKKGARK